MTIKKRALLIICGVIIFLVLAPAAVFFAQGYRFDFDSREIIKTGSLSVKTNPRGAETFLSGEKLKNTPLVKRFILPGEYQLTLEKPGYFPWNKNIAIRPQLVTKIPATESGAVTLLLRDGPSQTITSQVADFILSEDNLYFTTAEQILRWRPGGGDPETAAEFSETMNEPRILQAQNGRFLLADGARLVYLSAAGEYDIAPQISRPVLENRGSQASVLGLDADSNLVRLNPETGEKTVIRQQVRAFALLENDLYIITAGDARLVVMRAEPASAETELAALAPAADFEKIIVSSSKKIFVMAGGELHEIAEQPRKIAGGAGFADWDAAADALFYGNGHELWKYSPLSSQPNRLLMRNLAPITSPAFSSETGYVFAQIGDRLIAAEMDAAGAPNTYILLEPEGSIKKIALLKGAQILVYLDGDELKTLKIR